MDKSDSEERLRLVLDEHATRAFPGGSDIWPQLRNRVAAAASRNTARPRLVSVQVAIAACLLLTVFAVGVLILPQADDGGSANVSLGGRAVASATAIEGIAVAQVLTQTIDGYTMELQPLFADKNQIVINFKLTGPDNVPLGLGPSQTSELNTSNGWLALVDDQGNRYMALPIEFNDPQELATAEGLRQSVSAILRFDASKLGATPLVHLRLRPNIFRSPISATPDDPQLAPTQESTESIAMPFDFEFELPVDQEMEIAEVHQTVEAAGLALTLERVIVTATSAKAIVKVRHLDGSTDQMVLDDTKLRLAGLGEFSWRGLHLADDYLNGDTTADLNLWAIHFNAPDWHKREFLSYEGRWMMTLNSVGELNGVHFNGPWEFHFNGPIAADSIPTALPLITRSVEGTPLHVVIRPPSATPSATATPTAQTATVRVTVTKGRADAWVQVTIDGKVVMGQTLAAGTSREFIASERINIRTGRGDIVRVEINGVDKGYMGDRSHIIVEREWDRNGNEIK